MSQICPGLLSPPRESLTPDEWRARGRARRERVSLEEHAYRDAPSDRPDPVSPKRAVQRHRREIRKAQRRTSLKAMTKFCDQVEGKHWMRPDHPVIVRFPVGRNPEMLSELRSGVALYQETLPADRREVLRRYHFGDFARKVVGVGSVGTEAFVLLLMGDRDDEPLFFQIKEAQESVLAPFAGPSEYEHQGERVARGQRMLQAATDEFSGWTRGVGTAGAASKDYQVRQLRDMTGSMDVPAMDRDQLSCYAELCGWALARWHARTGRARLICGYLGSGSESDKAVTHFSIAYAEQNETDYQALVDAVATGRIQALMGLLIANPQPRLTGPLLPRARAPAPGTAAGAQAIRRRAAVSRESRAAHGGQVTDGLDDRVGVVGGDRAVRVRHFGATAAGVDAGRRSA
jgi:hypothetical protein